MFGILSRIRGRFSWSWRDSFLVNVPSFSVKLRQEKFTDGGVDMLLDEPGHRPYEQWFETIRVTKKFIVVSEGEKCSKDWDITSLAALRLKIAFAILSRNWADAIFSLDVALLPS